jgi:hypothetical protein
MQSHNQFASRLRAQLNPNPKRQTQATDLAAYSAWKPRIEGLTENKVNEEISKNGIRGWIQ